MMVWYTASFLSPQLGADFGLSCFDGAEEVSLAALAMARHTYSRWPLRKKGREE